MKKTKNISKKSEPVKKVTERKNTSPIRPTKKSEKVKTSGQKDFGGIKKTDSSTEKRKNVNADPNLIQSNFLYSEDEEMLDL
jgi:hypothetical protein